MNKIVYYICIITISIFICCVGAVKYLSRKDKEPPMRLFELFQCTTLFFVTIIYVLMIPMLLITMATMVASIIYEQAKTILPYMYVVDICFGIPVIIFALKLDYLCWKDKRKT